MEKITKREMFEAISEAMETGECKYPIDMVQEFCANEIASLDKKATKAKEYAAKKKAENDALTEAIKAVMSDTEFESIPDIAARLEDEEATVGKVQYRLGQLVKKGLAEKQEITIPATETSKTRKIMGYKLISDVTPSNISDNSDEE